MDFIVTKPATATLVGVNVGKGVRVRVGRRAWKSIFSVELDPRTAQARVVSAKITAAAFKGQDFSRGQLGLDGLVASRLKVVTSSAPLNSAELLRDRPTLPGL